MTDDRVAPPVHRPLSRRLRIMRVVRDQRPGVPPSPASPSPGPAPRVLPPRGLPGPGARLLRDAVAPVALHLLGQLLTVAVVQAFAGAHGLRPRGWVAAWDGQYYQRIAAWGYTAPQWAERHSRGSPLAFFPGYPGLVGLGHALTGADVVAVGLAVSLAAGAALAVGLAVLARELGWGRRTGLVLVALVATGPQSVVLTMVYAEALFCAGVVWTLVLLHRGAWWRAGLLCAATGLVRPTGTALVVAVAVAVLAATGRGTAPRRAWAALLVAPCGWLGYLAWVGARSGSPWGWFIVERAGWRTSFDGGLHTLGRCALAVVAPRDPVDAMTLTAVVGSLVLLAGAVRRRLPWYLVAYAATVLVLDLGNAGYWNSKVRLMIPALPLLLVLARDLADRLAAPGRRRVAALVALAAWVALGTTYSGHALIGYPHAI